METPDQSGILIVTLAATTDLPHGLELELDDTLLIRSNGRALFVTKVQRLNSRAG